MGHLFRPKRRVFAQGRSRFAAKLWPLAVFVLVLKLWQSVVSPMPADASALADLKAIFGDAVVLCIDVADGKPGPQTPQSHCDGECSLCHLAHAGLMAASGPPPLPPFVFTSYRRLLEVQESAPTRRQLSFLWRARGPPLS